VTPSTSAERRPREFVSSDFERDGTLLRYAPANAADAERVIERVTPRLQHANSAVVLSAVKVILEYMHAVLDPASEFCAQLRKKLAPPLVTLVTSTEPELCYVALRNVNLVVQRDRSILEGDVKVFFCKYNDPLYVKLEKLEILVRLSSEKNVDQVLLEFKEYAQEVDIEFVRRAIRAIGRCAIKLEAASQRCVNVLLELIKTKVNYIVQEAIVVVTNVFRKYPGKYEAIISTLCESLDSLDEPEAKAAMARDGAGLGEVSGESCLDARRGTACRCARRASRTSVCSDLDRREPSARVGGGPS